MLSNFSKIFIKCSFCLFVFLGVTEEALCMQRVSDDELDKENIGHQNKRTKTDDFSPFISRIPTAGILVPVSPQRVNALAYDNPADVGVDDWDTSVSAGDEIQGATLFSLLGECRALELQIHNAALYKPEITSTSVDLDCFTPQKINDYRRLGGETPELRKNIGLIKILHPKPTLDTVQFPRDDQKIYSPAARHLPRQDVAQLRSLNLVFHLPDYATREPIIAETEEERALRKERQKKEFEASEALLGNFPKQLISEMEKALKPWIPYFKYVDMTKERYSQGLGNKLKWPDLVGAFLKYVAPYMKRLEIEGYEVYFTLKTLNFNRICSKHKIPNHELMEDGLCPVGAPDGEPMNWHHVTRLDVHSHDVKVTEAMKKNHEGPYKLVLIPAFIHTQYDALLHPEHYVGPRNEINRSAFGASRKIINETIQEEHYTGD